jgi:hypothetical protein
MGLYIISGRLFSLCRLGSLGVLLACFPQGRWQVASRAPVGCVEDPIPEGEEGLREVGLDAPRLVVNVVVGGVVVRDQLQRIPGEFVAAVVIDRLHARKGKEDCSLTHRHAHDLECQTGADGVEQKTLKGVVVQGTVRIRNVEAVVSGVEGSCW